MAVVPTILFLMTSVLKEVAVQPEPASQQPATPLVVTTAPVNTALQALKTLATLPLFQSSDHAKEWITLLRSTLSRIIDMSKTSKSLSSLFLAVPRQFPDCLLIDFLSLTHASARIRDKGQAW